MPPKTKSKASSKRVTVASEASQPTGITKPKPKRARNMAKELDALKLPPTPAETRLAQSNVTIQSLGCWTNVYVTRKGVQVPICKAEIPLEVTVAEHALENRETNKKKKKKKKKSTYFYPIAAIAEYQEYYHETGTVVDDELIGRLKYFDIVIEGGTTMKNGAYAVTEPNKDFERLRDRIAFRVKRQGDSGFGLRETGERSGVSIDENWFG